MSEPASATPGTLRRAKRGATSTVDGHAPSTTSPIVVGGGAGSPKTIVAEAKFEGLKLEGVNQNLVSHDLHADLFICFDFSLT